MWVQNAQKCTYLYIRPFWFVFYSYTHPPIKHFLIYVRLEVNENRKLPTDIARKKYMIHNKDNAMKTLRYQSKVEQEEIIVIWWNDKEQIGL